MEIIRQVEGKRIFSLIWMLTGLGQLYVQLRRESVKLQNVCGMLKTFHWRLCEKARFGDGTKLWNYVRK